MLLILKAAIAQCSSMSGLSVCRFPVNWLHVWGAFGSCMGMDHRLNGQPPSGTGDGRNCLLLPHRWWPLLLVRRAMYPILPLTFLSRTLLGGVETFVSPALGVLRANNCRSHPFQGKTGHDCQAHPVSWEGPAYRWVINATMGVTMPLYFYFRTIVAHRDGNSSVA